MALCNGCGGVISRDCFNPRECEWISQQQDNDAQLRQEQERQAQYEAEQLAAHDQAMYEAEQNARGQAEAENGGQH